MQFLNDKPRVSLSTKSGYINEEQKKIMAEFISQRPEMYSGKLTKTYTKQTMQHNWIELSSLLNSVAGGAKKEWMSWRKCWVDQKKNTKNKLSKLKQEQNKTGGGYFVVPELDPHEKLIAEIITPTGISGNVKVPEPDLNFDFNEINEATSVETYEIEMGEEMVNNTVCSDDHNYGEKAVIITPTATNRPITNKVERLTESIASAKKMVINAERKLEVEKEYYEKKLGLVAEENKNKNVYRQQKIELMNLILSEIRDIKVYVTKT